MQLSPRVDTFQSTDQRWMGPGRHGHDSGRAITLQLSAFTKATHYPNDFLPSGLPLAKLANGKYGPYLGRADEVQLVTPASSGNTTLTFDGASTAAISSLTSDAAGATALQAALEALPNIQPGDVTVAAGSGATAGKLVVTFVRARGGTDVPQMTIAGTGTAVSTATAGGPGTAAATSGGTALAGFLFTNQPVAVGSTEDVFGVLFEHGRVNEAFLPIAIDAAGRLDVSGRIYFQ